MCFAKTVLPAPVFLRIPGSHHPGLGTPISNHTGAGDTVRQTAFNLYIILVIVNDRTNSTFPTIFFYIIRNTKLKLLATTNADLVESIITPKGVWIFRGHHEIFLRWFKILPKRYPRLVMPDLFSVHAFYVRGHTVSFRGAIISSPWVRNL